MSEPVIALHDIHVQFSGPPVLQNVSLALHPNDIVTIIGPNGAGKTTLVKVLLGITKADAGRVRRKRGLRIGYVPQQLNLQPTLPLTVERFLRLAGAEPQSIAHTLERTGVAHLQQNSIHHLSGGEMQRVLLARALLRRPHLLVLDEPAQGVDINGQAALYELIRDLRQELGCAVLMVSHDLHLVMASTDQVICLNRHICCQGQPERIASDPAFTAMFGDRLASSVAVYHHQHNHDHDLHGNPVLPHDHTHDHPHDAPHNAPHDDKGCQSP
ncbi:MAG: zinc ABC transporter ATP-binding protein ZnuC [Halomonadaceae bacterium]|nr:MAG: zinc ABC transporter ATP-binding protein ZnuC [Halomonadaceae bacterium]